MDTGAWLAIIDPKDRYHQLASDFHRQAVMERVQFITTNLVIAESYTLIGRRLGHQKAIRFLDLVNVALRLRKIQSAPDLEKIAEDILRKYDDQELSYVDAVSFAAMTDQGLQVAFAFDHHFEMMGFIRQPYEG